MLINNKNLASLIFVLSLGTSLLASEATREQGGAHSAGAAQDCIICLNDLTESTLPHFFDCVHNLFHPECIERWRIRNNTCPTCRALGRRLVTPHSLIVAVQDQNIEEIQRILDNPLDRARCINTQNDEGATALSIAAEIGNRAIVQMLLANEANPLILDYDGLSPLDVAQYPAIINALEAAMPGYQRLM